MTDIVPPLSDRPAHYRLKTGTWEVILKAYVEGATVPELARTWRVSEHALRKRITQHGATKRDHGDAEAITRAAMRAGQLVEQQAEAEAEVRANDPEVRAARLFDGIDPDDDSGNPVALAKAATQASGRAMKGGLWVEAKALAGLAESYGRLAEREAKVAAAGGVTIETIDLPLLYDILFLKESEVNARFALWGDGPETEHYDLRCQFWARATREREALKKQAYDTMTKRLHIRALEEQVRDLGAEPTPEPP